MFVKCSEGVASFATPSGVYLQTDLREQAAKAGCYAWAAEKLIVKLKILKIKK